LVRRRIQSEEQEGWVSIIASSYNRYFSGHHTYAWRLQKEGSAAPAAAPAAAGIADRVDFGYAGYDSAGAIGNAELADNERDRCVD
jgi:hypothetical protein